MPCIAALRSTTLGAGRKVKQPHPQVEADRSGLTASSSGRLRSLDAVRGFAIVIMLLAGNPFPREHLLAQLRHPEWHGLTFADMFFPLFLFAMGVSMTLSRSSASSRLVVRRVALLALLGVALSSLKHERLVVTGVLQHIAGAYLLAWLVLRAPRRLQPAIGAAILAAVWAAFLLGAGGDGNPWSRQGTVAHAVDGWLLGGFSTEGGLQTVTSAVTVVAGALIGRAVRERPDPRRLYRWVGRHAAWLFAAGLLIAVVVPLNKRLWTPSFAVLTMGTSCAWFALFVWLADLRRLRLGVTPLQKLGANPIAVYVTFMAARALLDDYRSIWPPFALLGSDAAGTLLYGTFWVATACLFAHFLFRRNIFLKI
jgi:predicted acyltransferase